MRWIILLTLVLPSVANAESQRAYSRYYNGSFWDVAARGGVNSGVDGWALDIGLRQSFPMYLLDTRLSYRHDEFDSCTGDEIHVGLGLHPLYFALLGSDWLSYVFASIYAEVGAGIQLADGVDAAWTLGAGVDIPLYDPDVGMAPWLNVLYRYEWTTAQLNDLDIDRHTLWIGLSWRVNGLLW